METVDIENLLTNLGYKLQDRGQYWQCAALFRGGDNPNAIQIYKDSGVWKDYVEGGDFFPLPKLIKKTIGEKEYKKLNLKEGSTFKSLPTEELAVTSQEKLFDKKDFDNLLPHYSFYNKKGISDKTLIFFKSGMCTSGSMYQRYVFPIYNKFQQIHGVAGRDMATSSNRPKWKHMGRKTSWAYPLYCQDEKGSTPIFKNILDLKEVILVESIGDMLSLFERGYTNVLVTFGLDISSHLISILMGLNISSIHLSFNNDFNSSINAGQTACVKNFLKLLSYFDCTQINIALPVKNDFGDMNESDFIKWENKKNKNLSSNNLICESVLKLSKILFSKNKISKNLFQNIKKLPCYE